MSTDPRIDRLERRVDTLEQELSELRLAFSPSVAAPPPPPPAELERQALGRRVDQLDELRQQAQPNADPDALRGPRDEPEPGRSFALPELNAGDLLGARALAVAGGIVTLLGIVFFFVLAVNRGWIGPAGRVALGAVASAAVYGAGLWLRRRFGETHASLAAVGAGLAGGYATLLAATALYHFVGDAVALSIAAGIAAVGLATALRWGSQMVAGIGLLGATLAPLAIAAQGGLSVVGTWFVALMAVATASVAIRQRWHRLLVVGAVASLAQALALVLQPEYHREAPAQIVAVAAVFAAITVGTGVALGLREERERLGRMTTSFLFVGASFWVVSALRLFGGHESKGLALLMGALALGAVAAALFRRHRDLSALVGAVGLVVGGIAFGALLSGAPLSFAWAGEAAALAWLARRVKDIRYQLWGVVYLAVALVHVLAVDAPPSHLFRPLETSAGGALALLAVGAAATLVAWFAARRPIELGPRHGLLVPVYEELAGGQWFVRLAGLWLAGLAPVYAASVGLLAAFASFQWGQVAMFALWSTVGLGLVVGGLRAAGNGWLLFTAVVASVDGGLSLAPGPRAAAFLVVGATLLTAAFLDQLRPRRDGLGRVVFGFVLVSVGLGLAAFGGLLDGRDLGLALLGLATLYAALSAAVFRIDGQRDLSTLLWGAALVLAYGASVRLLSGTLHALSLAVAAIALAWLATRVRESRFLSAAGVVEVVGVATVVLRLAPPTHLFDAQPHPGNGALATLAVAIAAAVVVELARRAQAPGWWVAGVLAVYGLSLLLLEVVQRAFPGSSVQTDFQRGHTAVSAFWGLIGLALLYFGLTRLGALRVAGFALFGISLAKIFLYDLPSLSSVTRALSFLAVGAVLLLGGFFYQRLAGRQPPRQARGRRTLRRPSLTVTPQLAVAAIAAATLIVWFGTSS